MGSFNAFNKPFGEHNTPYARDFYDLMIACELSYNPDPVKVRALGAIMNCPNPVIVDYPDPIIPDAIVWPCEEGMVITIAGTTNDDQMWSHILGAGHVDAPQYLGEVHRFWASIATRMELDQFSRFQWAGAGREVIVAGHSYGAALAMLLAIRLAQLLDESPVQLITFGQPRVGVWGNVNFHLKRYWRICNYGDPVTAVPPQIMPVSMIGADGQALVVGAQYEHRGDRWYFEPSLSEFNAINRQPLKYLFRPGGGDNAQYIRYLVESGFQGPLSKLLALPRTVAEQALSLMVANELSSPGASDNKAFLYGNHLLTSYITAAESNMARVSFKSGEHFVELFNFQHNYTAPEQEQPFDGLTGDWAAEFYQAPPSPADPTGTATRPTPNQVLRYETFVTAASPVFEQGGETSMANIYKRHDRVVVDTTVKGMLAIEHQDTIRANPKPSQAISTRIPIIDPSDADLVAAWAKVKAALQAKLLATTS